MLLNNKQQTTNNTTSPCKDTYLNRYASDEWVEACTQDKRLCSTVYDADLKKDVVVDDGIVVDDGGLDSAVGLLLLFFDSEI
tara:strand:- start:1362 stop:1607 length:246 start_codon:yes stop_codon:yes gene_type:complete